MRKRKNIKKRNENAMKRAPVSDGPLTYLDSEPAIAQGLENSPLPYEEDKVPEPVLEEANEAQEPSASKDRENPLLPSEEVKVPEPVLEEANEAQESVITKKSILRDAPVSEYPQPEISPYEGGAATIIIGRSEKRYAVPINLIGRALSLQQQQDGLNTLVMLPEVDDDIGHTLIHYLYTGTYQTLRQNPRDDEPSRVTEYRRSVLAYHAALCYGFDGLADLGRKYMQTFDKDVPLFDIIALGRKYFPRVTEDTWYSNYVTRKIMASFDANEEIFLQDEFFEGFGEAAPEFDKFLGKIMAKAYAQKISLIREASYLKRVDEKPTMPTVLDGKPTVQSTFNAGTALERCNEQSSHADSEELASFTDQDALLYWKEYEYTDVESSQMSLLTPSRGTGEMFHEGYIGVNTAQESAPYLGSDDGLRGCPHWQQHSAHENLWKNCPSCKSYILNIFAGLILNRN